MISSINIVGSGNVAHWMAIQLSRVCGVKSVFSRDIKKAEELSELCGGHAIDVLSDLDSTADLTLICTSDSVIQQVSDQISPDLKVVHVSGFTDVMVLSGHKDYGVFYPLQTISKDRITKLENVPLFIEANTPEFEHELIELAQKISTRVEQMGSNNRKVLHLAAVFANNFTNHMLGISDQILIEVGQDISVFKPLIIETVNKALEMGSNNAQTGPAKRGDNDTMSEHLSMLKKDDWKLIYKVISDSIKQA